MASKHPGGSSVCQNVQGIFIKGTKRFSSSPLLLFDEVKISPKSCQKHVWFCLDGKINVGDLAVWEKLINTKSTLSQIGMFSDSKWITEPAYKVGLLLQSALK